jgi:hypothetical protein
MCATVRDQRVSCVRADVPCNGFDAQGSSSFADAHRAGSPGNRERRLEGLAWQVDDVGWQLGHAVGNDRACEVDRLAFWSSKG